MMNIVGNLIGPVTGLLDKVIEDKDQKAALAHEIATMSDQHAQQALMGQLEINKAEAASGSLFKGGWRPFIGWVCGFAFAYHFVLQPLIVFGVTAAGVDMPELPSFDMGSLLTVMMGMLGLGGLRSVEKLKKIEK
ncbi:MAG: holin family protein [Paracoccaceae bacterium]